MPGGGDPCIAKLKAVVNTAACSLRGEARAVQRSVKIVTGTISSEHTSSTISTMCSGRQPENEQSCQRIAERRYWFPPVILIDVRTPFCGRNRLAMLDQTRAPLAFDDILVQHDKVLFVTFRDLDRGLHQVRREDLFRNTRKTGRGFAPDVAPSELRVPSFIVWRGGTAPFALLKKHVTLD